MKKIKKLKIEITFKDKYTGDFYDKGKVIKFDDKRASELLADKRNLVSEVKETKKSKK